LKQYTDISKIPAIDVHCHFGKYIGEDLLINSFMSADINQLVKLANVSHVAISLVSPLEGLLPRGHSNPIKANEDAFKEIRDIDQLMQWVIVNPLVPETFVQAEEMLRYKKCVGIKIHPEEHRYCITEYGEKIFKFAAKAGTIIETHSGEGNSLPEDFIPFVDAYPEVKLILSHLGCSIDGDPSHQVRAVEKAKHGNVYTDTSSASSIMCNLIEWAVKEIGAEKILFGTDSPLYFAPMQRARIDNAELNYEEKKKILCDNAMKLINLGDNCNE
jgi:predicted TIM-barrel fold metal-dependent hydrolase